MQCLCVLLRGHVPAFSVLVICVGLFVLLAEALELAPAPGERPEGLEFTKVLPGGHFAQVRLLPGADDFVAAETGTEHFGGKGAPVRAFRSLDVRYGDSSSARQQSPSRFTVAA